MNATPFSFFVAIIKRYRTRYLMIGLFELLQAASGISAPFVFGLLLDTVSSRDSSIEKELMLLSVFLTLILGDMMYSRFSGRLFVRTLADQRHWAVEWLYGRVLRYPNAFYSKQSSGLISHRLAETSVSVNQVLGCVIFDFWPMLVALCSAALMLFTASLWLGIFMTSWISIYFVASFLFAKKGATHALRAAKSENETNAHISDTLTNHLLVDLLNGSTREVANLKKMLTEEKDSINRANNYFELVRWAQFGAMATLAIVVVILSFWLYKQDKIGVAPFAMAIGLIINIINYTHNLSQRLGDFFGFWGRLSDGVFALLKQGETAPCTCTGRPSLRGRDIHFDRISFAYDAEQLIIKNFTLKIPAGQKIGIVGPSGAGKSTILRLLLRLHEPISGGIWFGDERIDAICPENLRSNIAVIPQEALLFNRSILENLRYGHASADVQRIESATRLAHAHDFIDALPDSYDTLVGCNGVALSGGERQRIAIARAFAMDASVLIVDEATANLDPLTEDTIRDALLGIRASTTVLVVAHRLRMVAPLDRIIVLEHGVVVEDGTHDELIARGGLYRALWERESESPGDFQACQ